MNDETAKATNESQGSAVAPLPAKTTRPSGFWAKFWWIPTSFIVPFVVIYLCLGTAAHLNIASCFRSGTIGLIMGAAVFGLWSVDQKIQGEKDETPVGPMIGMLGMMLWLGWVVAAHVMVLANDEATYVADIDDSGPYTISRPAH